MACQLDTQFSRAIAVFMGRDGLYYIGRYRDTALKIIQLFSTGMSATKLQGNDEYLLKKCLLKESAGRKALFDSRDRDLAIELFTRKKKRNFCAHLSIGKGMGNLLCFFYVSCFFQVEGGLTMAMSATEIEELIRKALPDADVTLTDLAGDGSHYAAKVVSTFFKGKTRIQQHQMIYSALQGKIGDALHALTLTTTASS